MTGLLSSVILIRDVILYVCYDTDYWLDGRNRMSEGKESPAGQTSWLTWLMAAVIAGYIVALNVLAFYTVFAKQ